MLLVADNQNGMYQVFDTDDFTMEMIPKVDADNFFKMSSVKRIRYGGCKMSIMRVSKTLNSLWIESFDKCRVVICLYNLLSKEVTKPIEIKTSRVGGLCWVEPENVPDVTLDNKKQEFIFYSGYYNGRKLYLARVKYRENPLEVKFIPCSMDSPENKRIIKEEEEYKRRRDAHIREFVLGKNE